MAMLPFVVFAAFYVACLAITFLVYSRPGGLLHAIERGRAAPSLAPAPAE